MYLEQMIGPLDLADKYKLLKNFIISNSGF